MRRNQNAYNPEQELPQGSVLFGFAGAFFGAAIGVIPYGAALLFYDPSMDNREVWESLGLIVGYCACLGYRGMRGRRSTATAYVVVALCALLTMTAANAVTELHTLISAGARLNIETLRSLLKAQWWTGTAVGAAFGMLGIWSARPFLLWYTDIDAAVRKYGEQVFKASAQHQMLPQTFTVQNSRRKDVTAVVCSILFGALLVISAFAFDPVEERNWLTISFLIYPPCIVGSVYTLLCRRNYRLEAEGEYLCYTNAFGIQRDFYAGDIYGWGRSPLTGNYKLYDREGWLLGWFGPEMENSTLLIQYLREHGIGSGAEMKKEERNR